PRSLCISLFPYTTLFRSCEYGEFSVDASSSHRWWSLALIAGWKIRRVAVLAWTALFTSVRSGPLGATNGRSRHRRRTPQFDAFRSEEHTSELQSRGHLVC